MRKALIVGIDNYQNRHLRLSGCVSDAEKLAKLLQRNSSDNSLNFTVETLLNVQSSRRLMESIIDLFSLDLDLALFYFSGHGYVNEVGTGILMPDAVNNYDNYYKGIQMEDILDLANQSKARNKVIILDCCYSGAFGDFKKDEAFSVLYPGVSIITACKNNGHAIEQNNGGVFTRFLCEALEGGAADNLGIISMAGIYGFIDTFMGWEQRPMFKSNISESVTLRKVKPKIEYKTLIDLVSLFNNPDYVFQLDPDYEPTHNSAQEMKEGTKKRIEKEKKENSFKKLQDLLKLELVKPQGTDHMYYAAMESKTCILTSRGKLYWMAIKSNIL